MNHTSQTHHWRWQLLLLACCISPTAQAHVGTNAGWFHPLSGLDHFLAMVAVGAWSSHIGGRAVWSVPCAFVLCMLLGGLLGLEQVDLPGVEIGIALSVLLLGLAIGLDQRFPLPVAAAIVGLFGVFHGYAHGYEMPVMDNKLQYVGGFLATTAGLHLLGALGAHGLLRRSGRGGLLLRGLGFVCAACGAWLSYLSYQQVALAT